MHNPNHHNFVIKFLNYKTSPVTKMHNTHKSKESHFWPGRNTSEYSSSSYLNTIPSIKISSKKNKK